MSFFVCVCVCVCYLCVCRGVSFCVYVRARMCLCVPACVRACLRVCVLGGRGEAGCVRVLKVDGWRKE